MWGGRCREQDNFLLPSRKSRLTCLAPAARAAGGQRGSSGGSPSWGQGVCVHCVWRGGVHRSSCTSRTRLSTAHTAESVHHLSVQADGEGRRPAARQQVSVRARAACRWAGPGARTVHDAWRGGVHRLIGLHASREHEHDVYDVGGQDLGRQTPALPRGRRREAAQRCAAAAERDAG